MNVFLEDYNSIIKENEKKMFADISYNLLISENQGGDLSVSYFYCALRDMLRESQCS